MKITFKQVEVFVAVARMANMTRAAEVMHLTQSACSMALSSLENQLGGVLFDRHGKKLILNERGRILFPKAANVITQIQELQDVMIGKNQRTFSGHLLIGASTTIGNYLLPKIIGDFVRLHTQAKVSLKVANTEEIIQKLLKFEIDVGMIEGNCHSEGIEVLPWKKDELIIIASEKNPLARKKKISLEDLHQARWILREQGSGTREKFEEAMRGKVSSYLEFGHTEAVKQAVQSDLGISCLSKIAVAELLKSGQLRELKTPFLKLTRDFYILLHKDKYRTGLLLKFLEECQKFKVIGK